MSEDEALRQMAQDMALAYNRPLDESVQILKDAMARVPEQIESAMKLLVFGFTWLGIVELYRTGWRMTGGPR